MKIRAAFLTTAALACLFRSALAEYDEPAEIHPEAANEEMTTDDAADESTNAENGTGVEIVNPDSGDMEVPDGGTETELQSGSEKHTGVKFRFSVTPTYDDNIFIQKKNKESDSILSVAGGLTLGIGDVKDKKDGFISLRYDANAFFFNSHSNLDSVDHDAALEAQWTGAKLTVDTTLDFRDLTGTNNETADRINRKSYEGVMNLTYLWSDKTTIGAELAAAVNDYEKQLNIEETHLKMWADYEASELTKVGAGITLGQVSVSKGRDQIYEQLLARIDYEIDAKVGLRADAGCEFRQIENGSSEVTPVFNVEASYTPYDLLKFRIGGYRNVSPSIINSGANTVVTGVSVGATYRFMRKYELNTTGAYERTAYEATGGNESISRNDDYFLVRIGLSYALTENMQIGVFYQYRTNNSTLENRSFENRQVGMQLGYSF